MQEVKDTTHYATLNPAYFRPGTKSVYRSANYVLQQGGLGDYVAYCGCLEWIARTQPQIIGRVYCEEWIMPLAENVLSPYAPKWRVHPRKKLTKKKEALRPTLMPSSGVVSRVGCHSTDLAFIYYLNMCPPPEDGYWYPKLHLEAVSKPELSQPYAVMTPVFSQANKAMAPSAFNGIKDYFLGVGVTPVFLGNKQFSEKRKVSSLEEYDLSGGINLIGETSLLEAAKIMGEALVVVGLDNGLLHLAATTEVPIVYGYTISSVEHTMPRRKAGINGNIWNIYPDRKSLSCTFCQSNMRQFFTHDFKQCLYKDNLCTEALSDPSHWIGQIEEALKVRAKGVA